MLSGNDFDFFAEQAKEFGTLEVAKTFLCKWYNNEYRKSRFFM